MIDLIRREDAIETAYQLRHKQNDEEWAEWLKAFNSIPSVNRPQIELEKKVNDSEYFRGRVDGLEYVIDTLQDILQRKESDENN